MTTKRTGDDSNSKKHEKFKDSHEEVPTNKVERDLTAKGSSHIRDIRNSLVHSSPTGSLGNSWFVPKTDYPPTQKRDWNDWVRTSRISNNAITMVEELERKTNQLKQDNIMLLRELQDQKEALLEKKTTIAELKITIDKQAKKQEELYKQQRFQHLLYRVNASALEKLWVDVEFRQEFERDTPQLTAVMAIDIRRSTELMLKAKDAASYQLFIMSLCETLKKTILENYGVFDKFTGDGILAFFPEFYSGDDTLYLAIKSAEQCHNAFVAHYNQHRKCFTTILNDIGLGIGIDYGESQLVNMEDWLTVIGRPVVYACRLSACEAGLTLLNQCAYEIASDKYGAYINFGEHPIDIKNEGQVLAYAVSLGKKQREIIPPKWLPVSEVSLSGQR